MTTGLSCPLTRATFASDQVWPSAEKPVLVFETRQSSVGAVGVVSVVGHVLGSRIAQMMAAHRSGDVERAAQLNASMIPAYVGMFRTQGAILAKAALTELGLPAGPVRLPLVDATPEQRATLRVDLAEAGVAGFAA